MTYTIAMGGFMFGYDTGVISSAMLLLEKDFFMTALQKGFVVGATTFGAFIGGIGSGSLSDFSGRRITLIISSIIFIVGAIILALASSYELLIIGRLIVGIAVGITSQGVPVYISEISPRFHRGHLVTMNVLMCTGGQFFSYLIATFLVFPGGLFFVPESPRYLVLKEKNEQAKNVLSKIYPDVNQNFLDEEIQVINESIETDYSGSYKQLIKHPNLRPLIICCGLQLFQQLSGFDTAMYYGATIMKMAGFSSIRDAIVFSIFVSCTNFFMTVVALFIIDKLGRRKILLYTIIGTVIGLIILGIGFMLITGLTVKQDQCVDYGINCGSCVIDERCGFSIDEGTCVSRKQSFTLTDQFYNKCPNLDWKGSTFTLASLVFFVMAYALGLGHTPWTLQSELFPLNVRGRATGIATATNWMTNLIVSITFLPLTEMITISGTFWMYSGFMVIGWIFVFNLVPETCGKSLEEIQGMFL
ncbi:2335_t:CDS:10 [Diversispora eburnea]|uniref:2335_t:CDS:1 n=1 Tax=Diversispora eburnea TaxID=1213867 RepID=A0A9N8V519_9GLOM|nr:2335_t:CDS:10 [Diversispora eburnea]